MAKQKKTVKLDSDYFLAPKVERELLDEGWTVVRRGRGSVLFEREKPAAKKKAAAKKKPKK